MSGFYASDVATCSKHSQFFTTAYTCDNMTPRQVSWFSYFVWTLYNFKTLFQQVARHVTWRRYAKFDASSWIETQHTPNTMNNIFRSTILQYSIHLQFKFELYIKIQHNQINQPNITKNKKKHQIWTWSCKQCRRAQQKIRGQKNKKNWKFAECHLGTRQRIFLKKIQKWLKSLCRGPNALVDGQALLPVENPL